MEWRQLVHFETRGWDGFSTWAACDADGVVHVRRRMIHPNGTPHFIVLTEGKPGFMLSFNVQRGVHNGGRTVVTPQRAIRVLAYALDSVPFDVCDMAAAAKYEALRVDDTQPLSFANVAWYLKGETMRRGIRASGESARDTEQHELEGEVFKNMRCRLYDMNGDILDTWVSEDGKFQVSTFGRVRYVLGDNGVFHYTKGCVDGNGYLLASMRRFAADRSMGIHILVMHTFVGFPDELGHNPCVTTVDHRPDHTPSNNNLSNLHYANRSEQCLNRSHILQKHGVDKFDDLPKDMLVRAQEHLPPKLDEPRTYLELIAQEHLKDAPLSVLQMFMQGKRLCDASTDEVKRAQQIGETMFAFDYTDLEHMFDKSDWVFPYKNWKELDVNLMVPRDRIDGSLKALAAAGVILDRDAVFTDDRQLIRLKLLFNRVMMYHHHLAGTGRSLKRKLNEEVDQDTSKA